MADEDLAPVQLQRTKSWKEYDGRDEIPMILNEGLLPIKFQTADEVQDLDYEGALRFYYIVDGESELTKAVRLTNRSTVRELIPILIDKFSLPEEKEYVLYENYEEEETTLLYAEECPLARAISSKRVPRFILKLQDFNNNSEDPEEIQQINAHLKKEKKKRIFSLSKKDSEKKKVKFDVEKTDKAEKVKKSKKKKKDKHLSESDEEILSDEGADEIAVTIVNGDSQFFIEVEDADKGEQEPVTAVTLAPIVHQTIEEEEEEEENESIEIKEDNEHQKLSKQSSIQSVESEIIAAQVATPEFSLPDSFLEAFDEVNAPEGKEQIDDNKDIDKTVKLVEEVQVESVPEATTETAQEEGERDATDELSEKEHDIDEIEEPSLTEVKTHRKLSFSNSSIFFEQDNDPPQLELGKGDKKKKKFKRKEKNKLTPEKRTRSFSNMLKGQKKKHGEKDGPTTELSTNKLTPGILKVFGDHVSKGSNYKAVRVSTISTSQEVVRMALEKYGFENSNPKDYVLCDVVGQFTPSDDATGNKAGKKQTKHKKSEKQETDDDKPQWTTEYVRAVNDNEKPLVLQSLWKPTNGRSRRFELRRRIDVESSCFFINTADSMGRRNSETSLFDDSDHSSIVSGNESHALSEHKEFTPAQLSPHSKSKNIAGNRNVDGENCAPKFVPYLLMVQGFKETQDKLVHKLDEPTVMVGPYMDGETKQCNVTLYSSDILLPHCWIYKKVKLDEESGETNLDEINFLIFIEPANGADITVNGMPISTTTLLKSGQLVGFGKFYLFIFKDPTQIQEAHVPFSWIEKLKISANVTRSASNPTAEELLYAVPMKKSLSISTDDKSVQVELNEPVFSDHTEESEYFSEASSDEQEVHNETAQAYLAPRKQVEKSHLQLTYNIKEEEDLLHTIIDIADEELGEFKLITACLFLMSIEHSAATFTEIQTRKLLLKISSGLQGIAWEKTKEIGKQSSVKEEDPILLLERVLPELKPVLFWMASALEMLHFLQCNIGYYLLPNDKVTTTKEALLTADEELLTVLEEVIMFTFQQTVYHLTKVLYVALPSIIDVNPFQSEDVETEHKDLKNSPTHPAIAKIITVFARIFDAAKEYQVHPQIISQLFSYLFFFSNASLFNSLMDRGPGGKFYRWTKGVQMRGNLDVLEDWAQSNGLSSQFEQYMAKFITAVDLLSAPKVQLIQLDWKQMRMDYAVLNPAQLQQLLGEYQLSGKPRPRGWYPPPEEVEPALRSSEVLESFATHPPLMLPSGNFKLDLNKAPENKEFFKFLGIIREKFGTDKQNGHSQEEPVMVQEQPMEEAELPVEENMPEELPKRKKSGKRSKSNINMEDVESAIQHHLNKSNTEQEESQDVTAEQAQTQDVTVEQPQTQYTVNEPQAQVGSVKSIQVQSKRTTITVTSKKTSVSSDTESVKTPPKSPNENGVDDLIKHARVLINANDVTSDDDDEDDVDKNLSGHLNGDDDVFVVELERSERGLGLGLIDGMFTSLKNNGIYVRTIVPNTPASQDPRLRIGDQILAVNGTSLVGSDYSHAMELIKKAGSKLSFLIAKTDDDTMNQVLTAST